MPSMDIDRDCIVRVININHANNVAVKGCLQMCISYSIYLRNFDSIEAFGALKLYVVT